MAPGIYTTSFPPVTVHYQSVFTHLFNASLNDVGGLSGVLPAYIDAPTGTTITRAQLKHLALSFGYGIQHHPSLEARRGDTLLIYSKNCLAWPVVLFGAVAAGLKCTFASHANELAYQYIESGAKLILSSEENITTTQDMLKGLGISLAEANKRIVVMVNGLEWAYGPSVPIQPGLSDLLKIGDLLNLGALMEEEKFDGRLANETAYVCYTSGTTGRPKGAEITHKNITSVLDQAKAAFPNLNGKDKILGFLPFFHIYGNIVVLHLSFVLGCPLVIMSQFDPVRFCANIEKYQITTAFIVPSSLDVLATHPAVDRYDLSTLGILISGAARLRSTVAKMVTDRFSSKYQSNKAVTILQGYGLTEASSITHLMPIADGVNKVGSVGLLLPNLEARLMLDGMYPSDAKEGNVGELWIRGASIMKRYLNDPVATKVSITRDGWMKTGDLATCDADGFYYIIDRVQDLIRYKGILVPPAELEVELRKHDDVREAAVVGVNIANRGTGIPRAYVVPARPEQIKSETEFAARIQKWMHNHLRGGVVIIDELPKRLSGKVIRHKLRERAMQELSEREPCIMKSKL